MESMTVRWLAGWAVALGGLAAACSAGTGDVRTVGGYGENQGPGSVDPAPTAKGWDSVPVGTMTALCIRACAHVYAADCKQAPATSVTTCESQCAPGGPSFGSTGPGCVDELADLFSCVLTAAVTCSAQGSPTYECTEAQKKLNECKSPTGSAYPGCTRVSSNDAQCSAAGAPPSYYVCQSKPSGSCQQVAPTGYCCP